MATDLKKIWRSHDIPLATKMKLLMTLIWHNSRRMEKRKTENKLVGQHQDMDWVTMEEMLRLTEDRGHWRNIVHDAAKSRNEEG